MTAVCQLLPTAPRVTTRILSGMWTALAGALGGAAGLGALLSPWLLHVAERRKQVAAERDALLNEAQTERNRSSARLDVTEATLFAVLDAYFALRHWIVRGCVGDPPTMPDGLTIATVRSRLEAAA